MSRLGLIYRLDWWSATFNLYLDIYLYIFYGFWKFQSMFHLLFFFQFCWVESCSLVATNPTLSVPCEGCGHQSKSHRRKMQRRSVQRNQTVRVMWVSVVNSEITRFSVVQHVAFAVNNSKSHFWSFLQKWIQFGLLAPTHFLKKTGIILSWQWSSQIFIAFSLWRNERSWLIARGCTISTNHHQKWVHNVFLLSHLKWIHPLRWME